MRADCGEISGDSTEMTSVGVGAEIGLEPSQCSKCSKQKMLAREVLEVLQRGRLDLAREKLLEAIEMDCHPNG